MIRLQKTRGKWGFDNWSWEKELSALQRESELPIAIFLWWSCMLMHKCMQIAKNGKHGARWRGNKWGGNRQWAGRLMARMAMKMKRWTLMTETWWQLSAVFAEESQHGI
jgi:hypothetical protein